MNFFRNKWENTLYTPTMIQKINDRYLIEDCWHNRIIYSKKISQPIKKWKTLSDDIFGGHTFAANDSGTIMLCDNTDKDILEVFDNRFKLIQRIDIKEYLNTDFSYRNSFNLVRPHFVFFDDSSKLFLVALSWANSLMILKENISGSISVVSITELNINKDSYLKFISKFDDLIWIAEKENWIGFEIINETPVEKKRFSIPAELRNQNFITKVKQKYFCMVWGGYIFSASSLEDFSKGNFKNANDKFNFKGTPYFMTNFDEKFWITEIVENQGIYSCDFDDFGNLINKETLFSFGRPRDIDIQRKIINPVLG